ncbi:hypothetical protein DLAC_04063 [Tieghemostelium lacteum]|uniref:DDE Tnp4 domain-containing protein n=1 Tax=Tieghemostelium lacteum TaxID=361077 RepID=A0A151ZS55_TIELA|nr:hypothetical protein DLAC_04063 [Tieghemostelium lacteum]|eukprot:KYQ96765.1 hypothetical protein DLAC_04063 [Tieghemostelium lacteum]
MARTPGSKNKHPTPKTVRKMFLNDDKERKLMSNNNIHQYDNRELNKEHYKTKRTINGYSFREFKKQYLYSKTVIFQLWTELFKINNEIKEGDVLMTLDYLRYFTSQHERAKKFGVSEKTFGVVISKVLLASKRLKQVQFSDRINHKNIKDRTSSSAENGFFITVVGSTTCPLKTKQDILYNSDQKIYGLKYEICVAIDNGKIFSVYGPKDGSAIDLTVCREHLLKLQLKNGERIIGDNGYAGEKNILTPHKKIKGQTQTDIQYLENKYIKNYGLIVENVFGKLKQFACLRLPWNLGYSKHASAFSLLVFLHNLAIQNDEEEKKKNVNEESNQFVDTDEEYEKEMEEEMKEKEVEEFVWDEGNDEFLIIY